MKLENCPKCNSKNVYPVTRFSEYNFEAPKPLYSYFECKNCRYVSSQINNKKEFKKVLEDWNKKICTK